ncbi:MAG: hypothetical protein AAGD10_20280 [Myxococcota bacterium]
MADSEVQIVDVAPDGAGRGRWRKKEARVPGSLAGERLAVRWVHVGPRSAVGRPVRILRAALERVPVPCPHFERCGGCDLLHATKKHQLALKRRWLTEILGREVEPVHEAPTGFGYRALAKLVVGPRGELGSYAPRSHELVSMEGCLIHLPVIEKVAHRLRRLWARTEGARLRFVVIRAVRSGEGYGVSLVAPHDAGPEPLTGVTEAVELLSEDPSLCWLELRRKRRDDDVVLAGDDLRRLLVEVRPLVERLGPVELALTPEGFSQVHPALAEVLFAHAVTELRPQGRPVADLYAGAAVLGRWALAEGASSVVAVESSPGPVPETSGLKLHATRVEAAFEAWREASHVFVNPPRKGLGQEVVAQLRDSEAQRLVYVSCGPQALARDLSALAPSFEVERIRPFDLFPQTRHVESVATLSRR